MEPAVTGLDWPFTTIPKSRECFARQQPCGPPSLVRATSTCSGIDRPASGFNAVITGPIKTTTHTTKWLLRSNIRFPYDYEETLLLASPQQKTPWPVFQDGRCNTSPAQILIHTMSPLLLSDNTIIPYAPHLAITAWFQELFHPPIGVLFTIPSRY